MRKNIKLDVAITTNPLKNIKFPIKPLKILQKQNQKLINIKTKTKSRKKSNVLEIFSNENFIGKIVMKFVVIYKDRVRKGLTKDLLKNHVEHIKNIHYEGNLFLCGFLKKSDKVLLILEAKSFKDAEDYIIQDPLIIKKHYNYDIYELNEANESNNWFL